MMIPIKLSDISGTRMSVVIIILVLLTLFFKFKKLYKRIASNEKSFIDEIPTIFVYLVIFVITIIAAITTLAIIS